MKGIYQISRGQLITLWIFFIIVWLIGWDALYRAVYTPWVTPQGNPGIAAWVIITIPFALIFYTIGWKNNRKHST